MKKAILIIWAVLLSVIAQAQTTNLTPTRFTNGLLVPNGTTAPFAGAGSLWFTNGKLNLNNGTIWQNLASETYVSGLYTPLSRTLTINGVTQDLSANRTWTIAVPPTPTLQTVTTAGNVTSNAIQVIGSTNFNSSISSLTFGHDPAPLTPNSAILSQHNGAPLGGLTFSTLKTALSFNNTGPSSARTLSLQNETNSIPGTTINSRVSGSQAINNDEFTTLNQVNGLITSSSVTANNGLTKTGNNITLGGPLTGTTVIGTAGADNSSSILMYPGGAQLAGTGTSPNSANVTVDPVNIGVNLSTVAPNGNSRSIRIPATNTGGMTVFDGVANKGLGDAADYSANKTNFDYATKKMLNDAVATTSVTSNNGLTKTGNNIKLGGLLVDDETTIGDPATISVKMTLVKNPLNAIFMQVPSTSGTTLTDMIMGETFSTLRTSDAGVAKQSVSLYTGKTLSQPIDVLDDLTSVGAAYNKDYSTNGKKRDNWLASWKAVKNRVDSALTSVGNNYIKNGTTLQTGTFNIDGAGSLNNLNVSEQAIFSGKNVGLSSNTGIRLFKTIDQVTNYERGSIYWSNTALTIGTDASGTGVQRPIFMISPNTIFSNNISLSNPPAGATGGSYSLLTRNPGTGTVESISSSNFATSTDLGNYVLKSGDLMSGLLTIRQGSGFSFITGADVNAGTLTNATNKASRWGIPHYTNAQLPFATLNFESNNISNIIRYGGGTTLGTAATSHQWFVGTNNTTSNGSQFMTLNSSGLGIGTTNVVGKLNIEDETANDPFIFYKYHDSQALAGGMFASKARGTIASPQRVLTNDRLFSLIGRGYNGAAWNSYAAGVFAYAEEDYTSITNNGSYITFETTNSATGSRTEKLRVRGNGTINIAAAPAAPAGTFNVLARSTQSGTVGDMVIPPSTGSGSIVLNASPTFVNNLAITGGAATTRQTILSTGSSTRWSYGANNSAESGSNVGSDYFINRHTDAGVIIDAPLTISRSTGITNITSANLGTASTAVTQATSDNSTKLATTALVQAVASTKQNTLVSGTTIKTINGTSLLGSGDLTVSSLPTAIANFYTNTTVPASAGGTDGIYGLNMTANTLSLPGDKLEFNFSGHIMTSGTKELQIRVDNNNFGTEVTPIGSGSGWILSGYIMVTGTDTFKIAYNISSSSGISGVESVVASGNLSSGKTWAASPLIINLAGFSDTAGSLRAESGYFKVVK